MSERGDDARDFILSSRVLALLLASAGLSGGGLYGFFSPQLDRTAIEACFDNSETALKVAAQNGEELLYIRRYIDDRTKDRYLQDEAKSDWDRQYKTDAHQDRRLDYLEQKLEE